MSTLIDSLESAWKAWNGDQSNADKLHDLGRAIRAVVAQAPITMQDVLLACGELNEQERVPVQWVLDRVRAPWPDISENYVAVLVNAMRLTAEQQRTLVRDLLDGGYGSQSPGLTDEQYRATSTATTMPS